MKQINAKIIKNVVFFMEFETNKKWRFKAGRLKTKDFFNWLNEKNKLYDKLRIVIIK